MAAITDIDVMDGSVGVKRLFVMTRNTVDAADTIALDLTAYGIAATGLLAISGWKHTTDGSVVVEENPTTSVSSGTLTITVPAGTDNDTRVYEVVGRSEKPSYS